MTEQVWTRQQQTETLRVIDAMRANFTSHVPQQNIMAMTLAIADLVPGGANATDTPFGAVAPDIVSGLVNLAVPLVESLANQKGISVQNMRDTVVDTWRNVPLSD